MLKEFAALIEAGMDEVNESFENEDDDEVK